MKIFRYIREAWPQRSRSTKPTPVHGDKPQPLDFLALAYAISRRYEL